MYEYTTSKMNSDDFNELLKETVTNIRRLKFRPRVSFGQNFVISRKLVDEMIMHAKLSNEDKVLEIGGGLGTLTQMILDSGVSEVFVVEVDRLLERMLQLRFYENSNAYIIGGDFLNLNLEKIQFNKVISNPPFHISSQIIRKLSNFDIDLVVMTFQKDFVEKMTASSGSENYSKIGVFSSLLFEVNVIGYFPKSCFYPKPKIDVSLVTLKPRRIDKLNTVRFWEFLTYIFNNRNRKFVKVLEDFLSTKDSARMLDIREEFSDKRVFQIPPEVMLRTFNDICQLAGP
ncbi:MAG: 16S rRNA (adenine(1518)-N(6)/adenine(1519)-N(6))-dimethyltransferase RsmA [Thermoproteota archaeon]